MEAKKTHCCFCSMQCEIELVPDADTPLGFQAKPGHDFPVATGRLCQKGLHALEHIIHPERIYTPLRRTTSRWEKSGWSTAIQQITTRIQQIQNQYGPDAIAVYGGGSLSNEVSYLLGKFARIGLGTRYIDYNGRYCMSASATAANLAFGIDRGLTMPLSEIPHSRYIILAGTNIAECQPTMMSYLMEAKKNGAVIVTIDPRNTKTSKIADIHIRLQPGFDSVLVNGLLHVIIQERLYNEEFVRKWTNGFDQLAEAVERFTPDYVERVTGVLEAVIRNVARGFAKAGTGIVLTARGLEQQINGVEHTLNYINLCLLTGKIGKSGSGFGSITGQANGQGGREHGQKADQLPGYRSIENEADRAYVAGIWGVDVKQIPRKGVSAYEMFQKIEQGDIQGMIIMGSNPLVSSPNNQLVEHALKKLKLLIVVDMFQTETAAYADWILPAASFIESEGSFTNLEGRVFHRDKVIDAPGQCKTDFELLCELARGLGKEQYFHYSSIQEVFVELCAASAGGKADYGGLSYERIKMEKGVFWPCPSPEHEGTPMMFTNGFAHDDGKARLSGIQPQRPAETSDEEYPYVLTTGRISNHYLSGTQTRRSPSLHEKAAKPIAEIHPSLAEKLKLRADSGIRITSRRGSAIYDVKITNGIHPSTIFVPFHWGGADSVNQITNDALHPLCKMPEFKISAVKVERENYPK